MDWSKGTFTGKPHISWEKNPFPVHVPLNQSIESKISTKLFVSGNHVPEALRPRRFQENSFPKVQCGGSGTQKLVDHGTTMEDSKFLII